MCNHLVKYAVEFSLFQGSGHSRRHAEAERRLLSSCHEVIDDTTFDPLPRMHASNEVAGICSPVCFLVGILFLRLRPVPVSDKSTRQPGQRTNNSGMTLSD